MPNKALNIYTDGACSGNPGLAGIGIVIRQGAQDLWRFSQCIGRATNNIAEYTAVIYALQKALMLKADVVTVFTDSELLYKHFQGTYRVKNPNIRFLNDMLWHLKEGFIGFRIEHLPRDRNKEADRLAKQAIKAEQAKAVASELFFGEESPSSKG